MQTEPQLHSGYCVPSDMARTMVMPALLPGLRRLGPVFKEMIATAYHDTAAIN